MTNKRLLSLAAAGMLVLGFSSFAFAGIPDADQSAVTGPGSGCININPTGTGPSLASKALTVTVTVRDAAGDPIVGYPFQDVQLLGSQGGTELVVCNGGSVADANTNASGVTTISGTIAGGGYTEAGLVVDLGGTVVNSPVVAIDVVSADNNRNLSIELGDIGTFAAAFATALFDFLVDLDCDGSEDLGDVGILAVDNGTSCP